MQPMDCLHLSSSRQRKGDACTAPGKRGSQRKNERENRRQEELFSSLFFFPFLFFILPVLCLFLSKPLEIVTDRSSVFQFLCQGVLLIL